MFRVSRIVVEEGRFPSKVEWITRVPCEFLIKAFSKALYLVRILFIGKEIGTYEVYFDQLESIFLLSVIHKHSRISLSFRAAVLPPGGRLRYCVMAFLENVQVF